jgi:hypothetical protein
MIQPGPWLMLLLITTSALSGVPSASEGATIELFPSVSDCSEEFENIANALQPGDELMLHGGTYSQNCRRAITVNGTATSPVTIRAATGESPLLTRPASQIDTQNNIEIVNSSYVILRGLRFQGGSTGVRFIGGHHITLEDSEVFDTGNNAISMNSGNYDAFIIRHNHIHHTGLSTSGSTEGEGMYLGCHDNTCRVTNSLVEGNYIHHLRATSDGGNDGIEVKFGSFGNVIRNNVIHDTNIGQQYPCIFVYGGGSAVNIVEGNAIWNCGEAIQVVSDAVIRNNLILNSSIAGITAAPHSQVAQMRNVTIVNNTIYGHPDCLYIRWSGASNMVLANNAVYCPASTAVDAAGLTASGITVQSNYVQGSLSGASIDDVRFFSGGNSIAAFVDPAQLDFWPTLTSPLVGRASAAMAPPLDFNDRDRAAPPDVGAYETDGLAANPGWRVGPGFKTTGPTAPPHAPTNLRVQ